MINTVRYKILMLIPELGFGGAERSFIQLARSLDRNHDVFIVAFRSVDGVYPIADENFNLSYLDRVASGMRSPGKFRRWLIRFNKLRSLKSKNRIDISISFLEGADILNVLSRASDRVVVSIRGSKVYDPHIRGLQGWIRRNVIWPLIYPKSDAIVAISTGIAKEVQRLGFVGFDKVAATIGLGLNLERIREAVDGPIESELVLLAEQPVVISWGRLSDEKGYQHLIRVFSSLKKRISNAKLIFVGEGPMREQLHQVCRHYGLTVAPSLSLALTNDVTFLGYRSNPACYARLAKVFVLSSISEGFSNALVEALATGLPVLAVDGPWGARSVLAPIDADYSEPFPTKVATLSDFGVLMPRIDLPEFQACWVDALANALTGGVQYDEYRRKGPERAKVFEESQVMQSWLNLVDQVAQRIDVISPSSSAV